MHQTKNNRPFFIHTFCLETNLTFEKAAKIWQTYHRNIISENNNKILVTKFSENGLRILFRRRADIEIEYDKEHAEIKAEWIVTPYKVLYKGQPMGKITSPKELKQVLFHLYQLFEQIEKETTVRFMKKLRMRRIDLTCDIPTPSTIYTREIISVCKATQLPRGYHFQTMINKEEKNWKDDLSCYYKNSSQGIEGKIYDKNQNLQDFGYSPVETERHKGLLRFEISLSRKCLEKQRLLNPGSSETALFLVMERASLLFNTYFVEVFDNGFMLSKKLQQKFLEWEFPTKYKKREKMLKLSEIYNTCRKNRQEFTLKVFPESYDKLRSVKRYYKDIHLSPIFLCDECPYIPSFRAMIYGEWTRIFSDYARKHTRGKELWNNE